MFTSFSTSHKAILGAAPAAITSTTNGTGKDASRLQALSVLIVLGAVSGTSPTYDAKLQESDTVGGTYTDIAGAVIPQKTTGDANTVLPILTVKPGKRFVRLVETLGGTTPSFTRSVVFIGPADKTPANSGAIFAESSAVS